MDGAGRLAEAMLPSDNAEAAIAAGFTFERDARPS